MGERKIFGIKIPGLLPKEGYSVFIGAGNPQSSQRREQAAEEVWDGLSAMPDFDNRVTKGTEQLDEEQRIPFEE